jgi:ABC-type polysaccharide/polyol phosphate transport system ATPase subunit
MAVETSSDMDSRETVISVRGLSKRFMLYNSQNDRLKELLTLGYLTKGHEFWALRDISFDVRRGETMGIVGRNGSGKSTLLKIICGTVYPTSGQVKRTGRISSLLELGIGFNPQLTGKENIMLQGAILGYSREEMAERALVIEKFADIGEFIGQPIKHYSSGMMVRLAFAAAINVDPDILIVDEALSVGDLRFQSKCFSKLHEIRKKGTTVLFVSHAIDTVNSLCDSAILLEGGRIIERGVPNYVINYYTRLLFSNPDEQKAVDRARPAGGAEQRQAQPSVPTTLTSKPAQVAVADKRSAAGSLNVVTVPASDQSVEDSSISRAGVDMPSASAETEERERALPSQEDISRWDSTRLREWSLSKFASRLSLERRSEMRHGNGKAEVIDFGIVDNKGQIVTVLETGKRYTVISRVLVYEDLEDIQPQVAIKNAQGVSFFWTNTFVQGKNPGPQKRGAILETRFHVTMWLGVGKYLVNFVALDSEKSVCYDRRLDALEIEVTGGVGKVARGSATNLDCEIEVNRPA